MIRLKCDPYPNEIWFTDDRKAYEDKCHARLGGGDWSGHGAGVTSYSHNRRRMVIGIFDGRLRTVVHELGHATFNVLDFIGQPVDAEHSEAYCYLQDHLFNQAYEWLKKKQRRKEAANAKAE